MTFTFKICLLHCGQQPIYAKYKCNEHASVFNIAGRMTSCRSRRCPLCVCVCECMLSRCVRLVTEAKPRGDTKQLVVKYITYIPQLKIRDDRDLVLGLRTPSPSLFKKSANKRNLDKHWCVWTRILDWSYAVLCTMYYIQSFNAVSHSSQRRLLIYTWASHEQSSRGLCCVRCLLIVCVSLTASHRRDESNV